MKNIFSNQYFVTCRCDKEEYFCTETFSFKSSCSDIVSFVLEYKEDLENLRSKVGEILVIQKKSLIAG